MGEELQKEIEKVLRHIDQMILAIKATGGYKERKKFRLSEHEIDLLCAGSEPAIREMAVRLTVAEAMLRVPAPSIHSRWNEYQGRRTEYIAELRKK